MTRADLHALVDSLPDGALENANRILQHLQVWPPQPSPDLERIREIQRKAMEQMRRSMRPGTLAGGGGGGSSFRPMASPEIERMEERWQDEVSRSGGGGSFHPVIGYGHSGHTGWKDDTVVRESCHFYKGHEIEVTERLQSTNDGKAIHYTHQAKGPKGAPILNETDFKLE